MSRLSSDWESTRLKIELSPVQIGEAAFASGDDIASEWNERAIVATNSSRADLNGEQLRCEWFQIEEAASV